MDSCFIIHLYTTYKNGKFGDGGSYCFTNIKLLSRSSSAWGCASIDDQSDGGMGISWLELLLRILGG
jgi:hypothetical protein